MGKGKGIDFHSVEEKWQKKWEKDKVYSFDRKSDKDTYSIDTPPPTVSGKMHLGHAFSYTQADFIARYKRMQGFNVFYPFGFDDNGLATERLVEKSRKIRAKDFTREEFIKICLEETKKHEEIMHKDFSSLGLSVDWSTLYRTIDERERKTSQKSFIEIYEKKRAYRKEAPSMWCPTCETAIAQAELEDTEKNSQFVYIKAEVEGGKEIVYATTRPELLHACVCISVHPDDKRYKDLVGKKAKIPISNKWVPIITDEFAKIDFGSGAVYWCPYGDINDIEFLAKHPEFTPQPVLNKDGRLNEKAESYAGMKVEAARKKVIGDLKEGGHVDKIEPIAHTVNVHERCKTPIEVYTTPQWFIKYLDLKDDFLKKGNELNWYPKQHMKVRYDNWIKGLRWDWSISRQRFFGVPFPVWYCKGCGETIIAQEEQLPVDPIQNKPKGACPKCKGKDFEPEKDVLDTWMTSSLTPQINSHWTDDKELYKKLFPMSMRPQAHDIITLWAFNTIVKAHFHENSLPWKDIMISGHALDPKGRKMSKSLGNTIEPVEMIEKYSADMLRYWAGLGSLGEDLPFQEKDFVSGKKFVTKLSNASKFVAMQTQGINLDDFEKKKKNLREIDKWILSRFARVKKEATQSFDEYEYSKALSAIRNFFWLEFADYYIEEVKHRVYDEKNKNVEAKIVLVKIATEILKMLAPFVPHITEEIFQNTFKAYAKEKSIHLEKWPELDEELINEKAEKAGELAKEIIGEIRKYKSEKNLSMNAEIEKAKIYTKNIDGFEKIKEDIQHTMKIKKIQAEKGEFKVEIN